MSSKLVESFFEINIIKIIFQKIIDFFTQTCKLEFITENPFKSNCSIIPCEKHLYHIINAIRNKAKYNELKQKLQNNEMLNIIFMHALMLFNQNILVHLSCFTRRIK